MQRNVFDTIWFKEHQKRLLWFANSWVGKIVFGINKSYYKGEQGLERGIPICKITPNSIAQYVLVDGKVKKRERFKKKNIYAKELRRWLYPFWMAMHIWDLFADPFAPQLSFGFNTFTVSPDAHTETHTVDGAMNKDIYPVGSTFAAFHDATAADIAYPSEAVIYGARLESLVTNNITQMSRSIALYKVVLDVGYSGVTAVMRYYGHAASDGFGSQSLALVGSTPASNTDVVAEDFDQLGTTLYANAMAFTSVVANDWNVFTLIAAGLTALGTAIAGDGIFKTGMRLECDRANSGPTGSSKVTNFQYRGADYGSEQDEIVVTYTVPQALTLACAQATYTYSGVAVALSHAFAALVATVATYTFTGVNIAIYYGRMFTLDVATYVLTGVAVGITSARIMAMDVASYVVNGVDLTLLTGKIIALTVATYTVTGIDVAITSLRYITLTTASYVVTGVSVGMGLAISMAITTASYLVNAVSTFFGHWDNKSKPTIGSGTYKTKPADSGWTNKDKP